MVWRCCMPPEKEALHLSNALRSFDWWRKYCDNIMLIDNQQYEQRLDVRETIEQMYERINKDVAKRITTVLSAGEVRPAPQDVSTIGYKSSRSGATNRPSRRLGGFVGRLKPGRPGRKTLAKSLFHNGGAVESGPRTVYTPYPADRSPLADIPNDWGGPKDVCPTTTKLC